MRRDAQRAVQAEKPGISGGEIKESKVFKGIKDDKGIGVMEDKERQERRRSTRKRRGTADMPEGEHASITRKAVSYHSIIIMAVLFSIP